MQNTGLFLKRISLLKSRQRLVSLWRRGNHRTLSSRNVSMTTKLLIESVGRFSPSCVLLASKYCTPSVKEDDLLDIATFEKVCDETLDSLTEYFEELVEAATHLKAADVYYGVSRFTLRTNCIIDFFCASEWRSHGYFR